MISETLGVVLAGGASSRIGTDKASLDFNGVTLLERAIATMADVFTTLVVAGGSNGPDGVSVLPDAVPNAGPLAGLDAAYREADDRAVFLLAVDLPFVDAAAIRAIAEPAVSRMAARVPVSDGRRQPLCAVYGSGLGTLVRSQLDSEDRSMARFVSRIEAVEFVEMDASSFMNVNTLEDLEAALRRFDPPRSTR